MKRALLIVLAGAGLASCATEGPSGPVPPPPAPPPSEQPPANPNAFRPQDFAWSTVPGRSSIQGIMTYKAGKVRYTCQGSDVILTPETPWSRRRMTVLYGSAVSAAVPVSVVRARTPSAPSGDYQSFVRKAACDASSRFSFAGLADGAWYVITLAKPVGAPGAPAGEPVAVMRRVETHGGPQALMLN